MSTTASTPTRGADKPITRPGDKIFAGLSTASGVMILITLVGVKDFAALDQMPSLRGIVVLGPRDEALCDALPGLLFHDELLAEGDATTRHAGSLRPWATSSTCSPPSPRSSSASGASRSSVR